MSTTNELADIVESIVFSLDANSAGDQQIQFYLDRVTMGESPRLDLALNAMKRRERILGDQYPFDVLDFAIRRKKNWKELPYTFLLVMSPGGLFRDLMNSEEISQTAINFELMSCEAIKSFLGNGAQAVRFAWPSDVGRPAEFPEAMKWLAKKMNLQLGSGYRQPRRKDGGVDIVAWRPFKDKKSAFPIVLVQCTIQTDLLNKSNDIDVRNWSVWLEMTSDPSTILCVPQILPNNNEVWNELALKNMIFDRLRVVETITNNNDHSFVSDNQDFLEIHICKLIDMLALT